MATDDEQLAALHEALAAPRRPPADPDLFSSNTLFGEPGIYPQGSPMAPAPGPPVTEEAAVSALAALGVWRPEARLAQSVLVRRVPDAGVRAGLLALTLTVAAPLVDVFVAGMTGVDVLGLGPTASPGRIVGPPAVAPGSPPAGAPADGAVRLRVVNDRYQAEVPSLLAGSIAHDLLWSGPGAGQFEEVVLHAIVALVHLQLLARDPSLAHTGTELARRQNSLAITLLNSRHPGSADISVRAPDGPGTIPGGAPSMQTPDFWSIPFVSGTPQPADATGLVWKVLELATGAEPPRPPRYDDALVDWWSAQGVRHALPLDAHWRAAATLGLLEGVEDTG